MKNFFYIVAVILVLFSALCISNFSSKTISSPDGRKVITVYRPVSFFNNGVYYIIPYKYSGFLPPKKNYALIKPKGMSFLDINWSPNDGHFLKIAFSSGCEKDLLNKESVISRNDRFEEYLDKGESFYYPKYESVPFEELN